MLAAERTFLAWQRSAAGLLVGAFAVVWLGPPEIPDLRHAFGALLAALAVIVSASGLRRWLRVERVAREGWTGRRSDDPVRE